MAENNDVAKPDAGGTPEPTPPQSREIPTWEGVDTLVSREITIVGPDGEKVDVMTFRGGYERDIREFVEKTPDLKAAVEAEDDDTVETIVNEQFYHRPTMEEQIAALSGNPKAWLEPFQNWVISAKNAGKTAISGSLQEKRVLAQQVFGSNLVLDCKKARGSCVKPWSLLVETVSCGGMVPLAGGYYNHIFR